jgi:hypothetical protein
MMAPMNLGMYVDRLRYELGAAADAGGEDARAVAERLVAPLESTTRLVLLEALSAAADEITRELAPGSVDVRLRGREPSFVVTRPPGEESFDEPAESVGPPVAAAPEPESDDGGTSRINLRLPDSLKTRVEEAAGRERLSVNAWLVRAAAAALEPADPAPVRRSPRGSQRYSGWVR